MAPSTQIHLNRTQILEVFLIILWLINVLQLLGLLHLSVDNCFSRHLSGHPAHAFKRTVCVRRRLINAHQAAVKLKLAQ